MAVSARLASAAASRSARKSAMTADAMPSTRSCSARCCGPAALPDANVRTTVAVSSRPARSGGGAGVSASASRPLARVISDVTRLPLSTVETYGGDSGVRVLVSYQLSRWPLCRSSPSQVVSAWPMRSTRSRSSMKPRSRARQRREQAHADVGRRGPPRHLPPRALLEVVGRQPVVIRADEDLEVVPGLARQVADSDTLVRRQRPPARRARLAERPGDDGRGHPAEHERRGGNPAIARRRRHGHDGQQRGNRAGGHLAPRTTEWPRVHAGRPRPGPRSTRSPTRAGGAA